MARQKYNVLVELLLLVLREYFFLLVLPSMPLLRACFTLHMCATVLYAHVLFCMCIISVSVWYAYALV